MNLKIMMLSSSVVALLEFQQWNRYDNLLKK